MILFKFRSMLWHFPLILVFISLAQVSSGFPSEPTVSLYSCTPVHLRHRGPGDLLFLSVTLTSGTPSANSTEKNVSMVSLVRGFEPPPRSVSKASETRLIADTFYIPKDYQDARFENLNSARKQWLNNSIHHGQAKLSQTMMRPEQYAFSFRYKPIDLVLPQESSVYLDEALIDPRKWFNAGFFYEGELLIEKEALDQDLQAFEGQFFLRATHLFNFPYPSEDWSPQEFTSDIFCTKNNNARNELADIMYVIKTNSEDPDRELDDVSQFREAHAEILANATQTGPSIEPILPKTMSLNRNSQPITGEGFKRRDTDVEPTDFFRKGLSNIERGLLKYLIANVITMDKAVHSDEFKALTGVALLFALTVKAVASRFAPVAAAVGIPILPRGDLKLVDICPAFAHEEILELMQVSVQENQPRFTEDEASCVSDLIQLSIRAQEAEREVYILQGFPSPTI